MTKLTKADIDGLVEGMPDGVLADGRYKDFGEGYIPTADVCRALYLAAGLQADGSPKPEKVRCWLIQDQRGFPLWLFLSEPKDMPTAIRGHFTPDGAE